MDLLFVLVVLATFDPAILTIKYQSVVSVSKLTMVRKIKPHAPRAEENRHPEKPLCVLVGRPLGPDSLEVESITEISTIKGNRQVLPGAAASKLFFRVAVRSKAALTVSTAIASAARSIPSYLLAPAAIADHGRLLRPWSRRHAQAGAGGRNRLSMSRSRRARRQAGSVAPVEVFPEVVLLKC
jgi:hypothetical protein